ncbi:lipid-binding SYLF domain-containing protein [Fulvivirgaceae bacterium BMA12]|uniref:Lipid-binding SYLF domain-containing protein n=1 Tax=Agaribacillus aureus TaxID=3051825 RepID=A0ABT8LGH7_9BACT|nr:lipid-binding SYLF domain-containing protein [Fulvivirgaceae bacterium BMA12]
MITLNLKKSLIAASFLGCSIFSLSLCAQDGDRHTDLIENSQESLRKMTDKTPALKTYLDESYGYVVFPKITKAGIGVGGATGKGTVFQGHEVVGTSRLKQASFGLQLGGQQYSEVILFKDEKSFQRFKNGNLKFDAQATAVALKKGAALDASYYKGVVVFTMVNGGLMYEASIGGQHFSYESIAGAETAETSSAQ